jgi:hypothetical protein
MRPLLRSSAIACAAALVAAVGCGGDAPRIGLRLRAGASAVRRGAPAADVLRLVVPVSGLSLTEALERTRWSVALSGGSIPLDGASLFAFPEVVSQTQAAWAVLLVPLAASAGEVVSMAYRDGSGALRKVDMSVEAPVQLGLVRVVPVRVSGPTAAPQQSLVEIAAYFRRFDRFLATACNISLEVLDGVEVSAPGADLIPDVALVSGTEGSDVLGRAGLTRTPYLVNRTLGAVVTAQAARRLAGSRDLRAFVYPAIRGETLGFPMPPALVQSDLLAAMGRPAFYAPLLTYSYEQPSLAEVRDPATAPDRLRALLRRESDEDSYGIHLDQTALDLVLHTIGHALGLPHPEETRFIDSGGGGDNFIAGRYSCLPDCDVPITQHQCEAMLTGITGYLH